MDFDFLALLALAAFWLFGQLAKKKKKPPVTASPGSQPDAGSPGSQPVKADSELDDALAEIRRALGMQAAPEAEAAPTVASGTVRQDVARSPSDEFHRASSENSAGDFRRNPARSASDEFHRVVTGRQDSEDEFESRRPYSEAEGNLEDRFEKRRPLAAGRSRLEKEFKKVGAFQESFHAAGESFDTAESVFGDPLADHDHVSSGSVTDAPESEIQLARLQNVAALREAFILKEIVGPPRALKRDMRG